MKDQQDHWRLQRQRFEVPLSHLVPHDDPEWTALEMDSVLGPTWHRPLPHESSEPPVPASPSLSNWERLGIFLFIIAPILLLWIPSLVVMLIAVIRY